MLLLDQGSYTATPLLLLVSLKYGQVSNILLQLLVSKSLEQLMLRGQLVMEVGIPCAGRRAGRRAAPATFAGMLLCCVTPPRPWVATRRQHCVTAPWVAS